MVEKPKDSQGNEYDPVDIDKLSLDESHAKLKEIARQVAEIDSCCPDTAPIFEIRKIVTGEPWYDEDLEG